ncbi:PIPO, partial [Agropyron mosaic virus]|uniref:PIPO n=1 Tax=Agropyron mosaic virus TaxID=41763 RepID=UPI00026512E8
RTVLFGSCAHVFQRMRISSAIIFKVAYTEAMQLYKKMFQKSKAKLYERNMQFLHHYAFGMGYDRTLVREKLRHWHYIKGSENSGQPGSQSSNQRDYICHT